MNRQLMPYLLLLVACTTQTKTAGTESTTTTTTQARTMPARPESTTSQIPPGAAILVGTYSYMADAGHFTHCATGARYPVAQRGENAALERAYGSFPHEPGAPVIVSVLGRLEPLPPMEGKSPQDQLIVDRVLRVWPDETCEKAGVETPLVNTYWKLVELNGVPVVTHENQKEAHLMLKIDGNHVAGMGGCNRFTGTYERDGLNLHFGKLAATAMACPYMDEEQAFMKALENVTSYQILGESLDLRGETGSLARLRAIYF